MSSPYVKPATVVRLNQVNLACRCCCCCRCGRAKLACEIGIGIIGGSGRRTDGLDVIQLTFKPALLALPIPPW
jgi:hypothetical protein